MLKLIGILLGLIPGLEGLASTFLTKAFDAKVKIVQAKTGADRDVAVEIVKKAAIDSHEATERFKAIAGSWTLFLIVLMFGGPYAAFIWKGVLWDTILGLGTTPPLKGDLSNWGSIVITGLFGSASAITLGSMWFNRKAI
jgi:hypothetical protein